MKINFFTIVVLMIALFSGCSNWSGEPATTDWHILFDKTDIPRIQENLENPVFQEWWQEQLTADWTADSLFFANDINYKNRLRHIPIICKIIRREGFVYQITGDTTRATRGRQALNELFKFDEWDYFREADTLLLGIQRSSQAAQACALAYDWLGDQLTSAEKNMLLKNLGDKGCEPCYLSLYGMLHPDRVIGWSFAPDNVLGDENDFSNWPTILSRTNLRVAPMSALALGALLLKGTDPRAKKWLGMVDDSFNAIYDLYAPDGSYPEGTGYADYTSREMILMFDVIQRQTGEDWKDKINWPGLMRFFQLTHMPSNLHLQENANFGDGGGSFSSSVGFWIAAQYQDSHIQYVAENNSRQHLFFSPIWYDATLPAEDPTPDWEFKTFDIGWIVATTGQEKDDFLLAMRSGPPANHEHGDRNSLLVKVFGENLLNDPWHPPYNNTSEGWLMRTSPMHNCVLVDGKGHQYHDGSEGTCKSDAVAEITFAEKHENYALFSSDATQAYQLVTAEVESVVRTVLVVPELGVFLALDQMTATQPVDFTARWYPENKDNQARVTVTGNRFELKRPKGKLVGYCAGKAPLAFSMAQFPISAEFGTFPHVDVASAEKNTTHEILLAAVAVADGAPTPELQIEAADGGWRVTGTVQGKNLELMLANKNGVPEATVSIN
ncbi:heparinase II/III family protein [bacterium]|nr:heparinase II/III family protein [bacterium]